MQENSRERIKTFDAIRALATAAVFVFHAGFLLPFADASTANLYSSATILNLYRLEGTLGTVGVSLFFVLSGFLLFYQMYKEKKELDGRGLRDYAKKRLLRILPLYYFSIFFIVLILRQDILSAAGGPAAILYNLAFLRGLHADNASKITINPVYWSLIIEMHFYFILPVFYYVFSKRQRWIWFAALAAAGIAYRAALVALVPHPTMQFLRLTPANLDFFAFGMLGAYCFVNRFAWLKYLGTAQAQAFLAALFLAFMYFYDLDFKPSPWYIFMPTAFGLLASLMMLAFLANERTALAKIFANKAALFVAKISFSIYIWHAIVIGLANGLAVDSWIKLLIITAVTAIFSTLTYYLIEAPFLKLKAKKPSPEALSLPTAIKH